MGEARRKKLAGLTSNSGETFDAVRRFWCGRNPGAAGDFKAPIGTVAVTLDVQGIPPSTCLIDAAKVSDVISEIDKITKGLDYYKVVRFTATEFSKAKQTGDDGPLQWVGLVALWTALHHPRMGEDMRKKVSAALRDKGKAHVTWQFSPNTGLAMALAEGFIDLEPIAAAAPQDRVLGFDYTRSDDPTPSRH